MLQSRCCPDWLASRPAARHRIVSDAEQIARDDAARRREDNSGRMQVLLEIRVEAVAEADGIGDSLDAVGGAGQEMGSLFAHPSADSVKSRPPLPALLHATVSDGSMLKAISV